MRLHFQVLTVAAAMVGLSACASDVTPAADGALRIDADERGIENGFSHYEVDGDLEYDFTVDAFRFEDESRFGQMHLIRDAEGTTMEIALDDEADHRTIFQYGSEITVARDGEELFRIAGGERVSGTPSLTDILYLDFIEQLSQDQNLSSLLASAMPEEQFAVGGSCTVDPSGPTAVATDGDDMGWGWYCRCVWLTIKAEASIAVLVAMIAAAGAVCTEVCAATVGLACGTCLAGALGAGALGFDAALGAICAACEAGCIPGCERWDCSGGGGRGPSPAP